MANIRGIELASEIYDLEDTSARNTATTAGQTATEANEKATTASETATEANQKATTAGQSATEANEKIGTLADLLTTVKTNLVAAINEIYTKLTNLINGEDLVTVAPGFILRKYGNIVFAHINSKDIYFPAQGEPMCDFNGNEIVIPPALRPQSSVNTFIADNTQDTVFRLRIRSEGTLVSWNMKYKEQTFELPIGLQDLGWQVSFCYSLLSF